MRKLLILLAILTPSICMATDAMTRSAMTYAARAFQRYPEIRVMKKNLEQKAFNMVVIERKYLLGAFSIANIVVTRKVSVGSLVKINSEFLYGRVRPDLFYDFEDNRFKLALLYSTEF